MNLSAVSLAQAAGVCGATYLLSVIIKLALAKDHYKTLPGPPGAGFLLGHLPHATNNESVRWLEGLSATGELAMKFGMFFGNSTILLADPRALYHMLIKDQHKFEEPSEILALNTSIFGSGLTATHGSKHRKQRKMLVPVFSIKHMRGMVPVFDKITSTVTSTIEEIVSDGRKEVELFEWLNRTALELIGQSGFGYSFDSLTQDQKEHQFVTSVKLLAPLITRTFIVQTLVLGLVDKWNIGGKRFQKFAMENLTWGPYRQMVNVIKVLWDTSVKIFEARKRQIEERGEDYQMDREEKSKDILTVLMEGNMTNNPEDQLPDEEIIAQVSTFAFAGMDTTSSATSRLLWLLSEHQDVQDRLRAEIREAKSRYGHPNYDELVGLPYLDAVCRETLRLYPPVPSLSRVVKEDAVVPLLKPIRGTDGKDITELFLPKGNTVMISIVGWNRNPDLWGETVLQWRPERWLEGLPQDLIDAKVPGVYSNLMTFLGGSRGCIGFKFAQLELKMILFNLLDRLKFTPSGKEMYWRGGIVTPAVDLAKMRPELPMMVERLDDVDTA